MGFLFSFFYYLTFVLVSLYVYHKLSLNLCKSAVCLVGKTAIVTGANTGIGYETALDFAKRGAKVILACINENRAKDAVEEIIRETDNQNVSYKLIDLTDLSSVRKFAKEINEREERLDILVNNAGAANSEGRSLDGHNMLMQCNYYGPFLLTNLLLDLLKRTSSSRIVNVSSITAKYGKINLDTLDELASGWKGRAMLYGKSKLCNIMFTVELGIRLKGSNVTTYSIHPGAVNTEIFRTVPGVGKWFITIFARIFFKTPWEGCQTTLHCALQKGLEKHNGEHFGNCKVVKRYQSLVQAIEEDPQITRKLWEITANIVGLEN